MNPASTDDRRNAEIHRALARRKEPQNARFSSLRVALDGWEDEYGISSAVAMLRIKKGRLNHPGWAALYEKYTTLIRQPHSLPANDVKFGATAPSGPTFAESIPPEVEAAR